MDFIIWYQDEDGNDQSFRFNGQNGADAPQNEFVQQVITAYDYNTCNGGGCASQDAVTDPNVDINIVETSQANMSVKLTQGEHQRQFLYWNPETALQVENGDVLSPATIFEHEIDHAYDEATNPNHHSQKETYSKSHPLFEYRNSEEHRVITGSETYTARRNGEISPTKTQSRYSHRSDKLKTLKVKSVTSTKPKKIR